MVDVTEMRGLVPSRASELKKAQDREARWRTATGAFGALVAVGGVAVAADWTVLIPGVVFVSVGGVVSAVFWWSSSETRRAVEQNEAGFAEKLSDLSVATGFLSFVDPKEPWTFEDLHAILQRNLVETRQVPDEVLREHAKLLGTRRLAEIFIDVAMSHHGLIKVDMSSGHKRYCRV